MKRIFNSRTICVKPFRAYIPPKSYVKSLVSPPYDVVNTAECRKYAVNNEKCFLRVTRPDLEFSGNPYSEEVYLRGKENLHKFMKNGFIEKDSEERLYIYGQQDLLTKHEQYGIIGLTDIKDYELGKIKKHEFTRKDKELDRTKITKIQKANTEPVFLTYKNNSKINAIIANIIHSQKPYCDFETTDDNIRHILYEISNIDSLKISSLFTKINCAYIADGHHRSASAYNVGKSMSRENPKFNYFMSILYPDNTLKVLEYNRLLKSLCGFTESQVFNKIHEFYDIQEIHDKSKIRPHKKGIQTMYLSNKWFSLKIKPHLISPEIRANPIKSLDVSLLSEFVLKRIFGISDLRADPRIDFIGGSHSYSEIEKRCKTDCKAAFCLYPVSVSEIMNVADHNLTMPPKSTWFAPKPKSGLVINIIDT